MLLSHKYKFIFLHCRKAAGSSITVYLNNYIGPQDIQVGIWIDTIDSGGKYNWRAINDIFSQYGARSLYKLLKSKKVPRLKNICQDVSKTKYKEILNHESSSHAPAINVKNAFPQEWNKYFKFCFVRNPYEKAISEYLYMTKPSHKRHVSFVEFLERLYDKDLSDPEDVVPPTKTNWPIYTINDKIAVDFIGRYENLSQDMKYICQHLGIPFDISIFPHKKNNASNTSGYQKWYSEYEVKLVKAIFRNELEFFGYDF